MPWAKGIKRFYGRFSFASRTNLGLLRRQISPAAWTLGYGMSGAIAAARSKRLARRCTEIITNAKSGWDVADAMCDLDAEFPGLGFMLRARELTTCLDLHHNLFCQLRVIGVNGPSAASLVPIICESGFGFTVYAHL